MANVVAMKGPGTGLTNADGMPTSIGGDQRLPTPAEASIRRAATLTGRPLIDSYW